MSSFTLGYLRFEVSDLPAWQRQLTEVIGLTLGDRIGGTVGFRMDRYRSRVQLTQGPLDDIAGIGLVAASPADFEALLGRLTAEGVSFEEGGPAAAAERAVQRFVRFCDPDGAPLEVALSQQQAETPFDSALVPAGFEADELGLGHVVLMADQLAVTVPFYERLFGARVTDRASERVFGVEPRVAFLALNRRHHSLAFGEGVTMPKRTVHFQFEVHSIDDVGRAHDRARDAGVPILQELGVHPDGAFSFYAATPSGFPWEVGACTVSVDAAWQPRQLDRFSVWGHRWTRLPV